MYSVGSVCSYGVMFSMYLLCGVHYAAAVWCSSCS